MQNRFIDLYSDTKTKPSPGMRKAMAEAEVGDDMFGEDPTVAALEAEVAERLGQEAGLFVPSGTMANQVALKLFTRPGDDVVVSQESHAVWHEAGASGANAGVQFTPVGRGGLFTAADFAAAFRPAGHAIFPATTLVEVENTHNRGGGRVFPQAEAEAICAEARRLGVARTTLYDHLSELNSTGLVRTVGEGNTARRYLSEKGRQFLEGRA